MSPLKLINLTAHEIWIEADQGVLALPRAKHMARVVVHYQRPAQHSYLECVDGLTGQPKRVRVAWPQWASAYTNDESGRRLAIEHLPAPSPGIGYVVTLVVAEQAAIDGRSLDDLYVVLEPSRSNDMSNTKASIIPAAKATPAMEAITADRQRRRTLDGANKTLRQLGRAVGEPFAYGEYTGFLVRTRFGAAYLRDDGADHLDMIAVNGGTIEAAATLAAALDVETGRLLEALQDVPPLGPVRPGEVRRVVLGQMDPEMAAIAELCARVGVATVSQDNLTHTREGDLLVECRSAEGDACRVIDHHHPGDAGYGAHPSAYLLASSIGQVAMALGGLHLLQQHDRVTAACDHCLGPAMQGRCPGVTTAEVERWLVEHEPDRKGLWKSIPSATMAAELVATERAPTVQLSADIAALDLRGLPLSFAASYIGAFRRDLRIFIYETEPTRPPMGWPPGKPCRRVSMQGMIFETHFAAFRMWAEQQGAVEFFPDCDSRTGASRGYAGFYI